MQDNIIYLLLLVTFIPINFHVLSKLHLEKKFNQGAIWQIKYAYIVITILLSHFMAEFLINLGHLFQI